MTKAKVKRRQGCQLRREELSEMESQKEGYGCRRTVGWGKMGSKCVIWNSEIEIVHTEKGKEE